LLGSLVKVTSTLVPPPSGHEYVTLPVIAGAGFDGSSALSWETRGIEPPHAAQTFAIAGTIA
jgi:hypothetical protein